jgi:hypothetical protein
MGSARMNADPTNMRTLVVFAFGLIPAAAQTPLVRIVNLNHPFGSEFQIGDRFEIRITGAPSQSISVRTVRQGRTDWGPVVASTDSSGRWSTTGQFEKSDFGGWSEVWTVGDKLATPTIQFSVNAPCLPGGRGMVSVMGVNMAMTCDTAEGSQTFSTPALSDEYRTPDGRLAPGRPMEQTPEQYHMEILADLITSRDVGSARMSLSSSRGGLGDETADLIGKLIGVNALNEKETQNALALIRAAFEKPETIAPDAKDPSRTLVFLRHLAELTDRDGLKQQIAETLAYVQAR